MAIQDPGKGETAAPAATAIVLKIPTELEHLSAPIEHLIELIEKQAKLFRRDGCSVDYAEVERLLGDRVAAV